MPDLLIKDIPEHLLVAIERRAARNHRSVEREALAILTAALMPETNRPTLAEIDRMRIRGKKPLTESFLRKAKTQGRA